ncbi:MAG: nitrogen regulation protein NR(II) [Gemmatimonadota bacterium]
MNSHDRRRPILAGDEGGVAPAAALFGRRDLLRWLYLARLTLVTGILAGALLAWFAAQPEDTLAATVMFIVALGVTAGSFWYTHILEREPGENFLYGQVLLDVAIVTGVVHITGGPASGFAPLYILVISAGALLLPLPGGVLIGALASIVYFADLVWGYQEVMSLDVGLQIGLFTLVAIITGLVGDRLRRAGMALGEVESELRQLRLDTGDILANLATGVFTVDGSGRLVYANPAAAELLGIPMADRVGRPVLAEAERAAPGLGRVLEDSIAERRPVERFIATVHREGGDRRLGVSTAVLDRGEGAPPSATAIFQDITDLERMEALHRRADRLEAIAELSASLAHEIKNPLASIRSAVEQLARGGLDVADREVLERLVLSASDRLSRLLSEFLDFSGLRLGPSRAADLVELVRGCAELVRQHPDARGVRIACEGVDGTIPIVCDPDLLHRAFFNLLLNAVQFAEEGGEVHVTVRDLRHRPNPRGTGIQRPVSVTVRDSGPGVDADTAARMFDPFFTTREGGSGLGLAVAHRAVEAHRGAIFVDNAPDGGARFTVYLPSDAAQHGEVVA